MNVVPDMANRWDRRVAAAVPRVGEVRALPARRSPDPVTQAARLTAVLVGDVIHNIPVA
ncbi:hypothetical protein MXD59_11815 [Frankia sp. Ag45/Mut15]|uniref:Uncharacterized protein n=1 Tax=Frankia umida TaxID=573489 RepID=A0ABT0JY31_9ACTN|nr:hypothetical protein [Frankia umida]MCK9876451.1 hypothetical protein [Frankia umida]